MAATPPPPPPAECIEGGILITPPPDVEAARNVVWLVGDVISIAVSALVLLAFCSPNEDGAHNHPRLSPAAAPHIVRLCWCDILLGLCDLVQYIAFRIFACPVASVFYEVTRGLYTGLSALCVLWASAVALVTSMAFHTRDAARVQEQMCWLPHFIWTFGAGTTIAMWCTCFTGGDCTRAACAFSDIPTRSRIDNVAPTVAFAITLLSIIAAVVIAATARHASAAPRDRLVERHLHFLAVLCCIWGLIIPSWFLPCGHGWKWPGPSYVWYWMDVLQAWQGVANALLVASRSAEADLYVGFEEPEPGRVEPVRITRPRASPRRTPMPTPPVSSDGESIDGASRVVPFLLNQVADSASDSTSDSTARDVEACVEDVRTRHETQSCTTRDDAGGVESMNEGTT